jgi:antitoxin ParD1/3/4
MASRATLSISEPNDRWIQAQIDSKEFSSRSEVINDLIRKAREIEMIRARLIAAELSAEQNGFVAKTPKAILDGFKEKARRDGRL